MIYSLEPFTDLEDFIYGYNVRARGLSLNHPHRAHIPILKVTYSRNCDYYDIESKWFDP